MLLWRFLARRAAMKLRKRFWRMATRKQDSYPEARSWFIDDGDVLYYAHSSYAIYATDGKLLKNVENHISKSDEIPEVVILPVGTYAIEARSERDGYVRVRVVIKAGRQTILDLDSRG
ncbi:MAG: hypothetical protein DMF71_18230 [Acidobacteria bacterium]|nr:MAG: hypothetical protein DMF71_18230 [Acidobacteriota bacterium]